MKARDIISSSEDFKLVRGVEAELLQRRRKGMIGGIVGIGAAVLQVLIATVEKDYVGKVGRFFSGLAHGHFYASSLPVNELIGIGVIVLGFGVYFTFRWTSLLVKESEEPFQYTFWIEPFQKVNGTPGHRFTLAKSDRLSLLHHDLRERLSVGIKRLSLLNAEADVRPEARKNLSSHINVRGHHAVREMKDDKWVLQVTPMIRIGPPGRQETLAGPIRTELNGDKPTSHELSADTYNQLVERIYSKVASEIYRQILSDVKGKSAFFPTSYLRALALYHEAVDFERSNTIDAYDFAIELYRESKRYFDIRILGGLSRGLVRIPFLPLWRLAKKSLLADAETRIGLARSLIYRKIVSALTGRNQNVLFEIPEEMNRVVENLTRLQDRMTPTWKVRARLTGSSRVARKKSRENEDGYRSLMGFLTFPVDAALRRGRRDFDKVRETLSNAYAVAALAHCYLNAPKAARELLESARASDPALIPRSALWVLATAEIEADIDKKLLLLRQATELDRDFEIAQYRFAQCSEMKLRMRGEIRKERVEGVIQQYEDVLSINPGNIGALLAQGYLWWLLRDWDAAEKKFKEGCETKAIVRQTFVGEAIYGLARIAVETGNLNKAYDLYVQAIFADPEVAAYSAIQSKNLIQLKYDYITVDVLERYEQFRRKAVSAIRRRMDSANGSKRGKPETVEVSARTLKNLRSFILNDYGNACLNYFYRFGDLAILRKAIGAYESAIRDNRENFVAHFNLNNAYGWLNLAYGGNEARDGRIKEPLKEAEKLASAWPAVLIESARFQLRHAREGIRKKQTDVEEREKDLVGETLKAIHGERDQRKSQDHQAYGLGVPQAEASPATLSANSPVETRLIPLPATIAPGGEPQKKSRVQELISELKDLRRNVKDSTTALKSNTFPEITSKIIDRTKWSFVPEGVTANYDGAGVAELLEEKIERDRLGEDDIEALEIWADLLSTNVESKDALLAAEKLCRYVLSYYPERFAVLNVLSSVYGALEKLAGPVLGMHDLIKPEGIVNKLGDSSPTSQYLRLKLSDDGRALLDQYLESNIPVEALKQALLDQLNKLLANTSLRAKLLSKKNGLQSKRRSERQRPEADPVRLNRQLLQSIFPTELAAIKTIPADIELYRERKKDCDIALESILSTWLVVDPVSFVSLKWATEFTDVLPPRRQSAFLEGSISKMEQDAAYYSRANSYGRRTKSKNNAEKREQNGAYHSLAGNYYFRQQEPDKAIESYKRAVRLSPDEATYSSSLGNLCFAQKQYREAAKSYERATKFDSKVAIYYGNLAAALRELKKWRSAIDACQKAKDIEPQNVRYTRVLATIYNAEGIDEYGKRKFARAKANYEKAIELDQKTVVYHVNLALALAGLKDWQGANDERQKAKDIEPQNASYDPVLATINNAEGIDQYGRGEFANAKANYEKAIKLDQKSAVYHMNLALALAGLKEWQRAREEGQKAIEIEPENADHRRALGRIYNAEGVDHYGKRDFANAKANYEKAINLDEKTAVYYVNLGLASSGLKEWQRAREESQKAIEMEPENADHRRTLGTIYNAEGNEHFRAGDYRGAVERYEEANRADNTDDLVYSNLAHAWENLSDLGLETDALDKAILALREATRLSPANEQYQARIHVLEDRKKTVVRSIQ